MHRDPRIDPMPGDIIRQRNTTIKLRVNSVTDDKVSWQRFKFGEWTEDNAWSIRAWRNIVAKNALIIECAK